ncbi:1-deoxy-D-xylulose-5-phosphate reductoisomerase [Arenimonas sp. GDDSR-1]|uniref:1-deoxy-D-xylulose-5-phosphate reductoisomerase n=1 Tax=Arenimonas sp. GDDSR-1 TaxID=2950125 RepID=UPI002603A823|nr:1-deoxy-D-xylulose-5-phosphate reductoisomerase [Arenimonas sp. GDDSR-1]
MKTLCLLGATGSIGQSTLKLVDQHPDRFRITALSAHTQVDALIDLCRRYRPMHACIADTNQFAALRDGLSAAGLSTTPLAGADSLEAMAADDSANTVVAAIVGAAGVASTLSAARAGKRILLANKESIVLAGQLLMETVAAHGAQLFPVDSEHNAIFQCLPSGGGRDGVRRLILTASGGPFLGKTRAELAAVTPEQACRHPKWSMGRKISVDSATLMNKGLEVIEAHHLFGMPAEAIEVVVHPQSIVHSMVDYRDGSVLAQMGEPDMRTAIAYGLSYPERIDTGVKALDFRTLAALAFQSPDGETFPCLGLAYRAIGRGGNAPAVLNAANEIAVMAFLEGRLPFLGIADIVGEVLETVHWEPAADLSVLMASDAEARRCAIQRIH